jgi:hypothetical protein
MSGIAANPPASRALRDRSRSDARARAEAPARGAAPTAPERPDERRGEAELEGRGGVGGGRQAGDHARRDSQLGRHKRGQYDDARARLAQAERGERVAAVLGSGELGERGAG